MVGRFVAKKQYPQRNVHLHTPILVPGVTQKAK